MAIGLRERGWAQRIVGVDANPEHAQEAVALGLVDEVLPLDEAVRQSDVIILATPVTTAVRLLPLILDKLRRDQTVLDVGSTKAPILECATGHLRRPRFVATHPMAGTEYSGPAAAIGGLFQGKACVFCDTTESAPDAVATVHSLYETLGMRIAELGAADHDLHIAYVSHISHIASFALALTVLEKEKDEDRIFELASTGFSSTVRLAKSNPDTWIPIFQQNRDAVLDVLDEFINTVSRFRTLLIKKDFDTFHALMEHANDIRRIIG